MASSPMEVDKTTTTTAAAAPTDLPTQFRVACENGNMQLVGTLYDQVASNVAIIEEGLAEAVHNDKEDVVDFLLKKGIHPSKSKTYGGTTTEREPGTPAIFWAAFHSNQKMMQKLISAGADVNAPELTFGMNSLQIACGSKKPTNYEAVVFLIENGADIAAKNKWAQRAVNHAYDNKKIQTLLTALMKELKAVKKCLAQCRLFTALQTSGQQRKLAVAKSVLRQIHMINLQANQFELTFNFGVDKSTLRQTNDQFNNGNPKTLMAQVFKKSIQAQINNEKK